MYFLSLVASKPLKPFQGLKLFCVGNIGLEPRRFKASKTLSGIETALQFLLMIYPASFKASKTLSGIETHFSEMISKMGSFKASKTLSGIETYRPLASQKAESFASKPLKPFQGLKHSELAIATAQIGFKASKTLSGIETS